MATTDQKQDDDILQIGDSFALECLPPRLDDEAAQRYIASKTLRAFQEIEGGSYAESEQLKTMADKESASNRALMRSSRGNPALFGGEFQLQHTGGNFLDLNKQMAIDEPSALRCSLADPEVRTKHTWFRFLPGYRTRNEGEPIRMGDTVTIQSMKKSANLYLHVGSDTGKDEDVHTPDERKSRVELNLSPSKPDYDTDNANLWRTQFRIVPVAKFGVSDNNPMQLGRGGGRGGYVCGGDYVEVFHRQSQGYLSVDTSHHKRRCRLYRPIADSKEADPVPTTMAELVWKLMTPKMAWSGDRVSVGEQADEGHTQALCLNAANQCGQDVFLCESDGGKVELSLNADDSAAQWYLQPFDPVDNGFRYNVSKFFLVNCKTGHVLHQGEEAAQKEHGADDGHAWFKLKAISATVEHERDVFILHSLGTSSESRAWLDDFQAAEEGMDALCSFHSEIEQILAMDLQAVPPQASEQSPRKRGKKKTSGFFEALEASLQTLPHRNLHLGVHMDRSHEVDPAPDMRTKEERVADLLNEYVRPPAHHWDSWAGAVPNDIRMFIGSVTSGMGDNPVYWDGVCRKQQQQILSGLGMIPFLVDMLQSLFQLFPPESLNRTDHPQLLLLAKGSFHLLKCLVKGNNRNAFKLYRHHEWLASMVAYTHVDVVYSITEIFKGTPALLHSLQLKLFIRTFWQQAIETRLSRFLVFLRDICFDELGRPLDSNQEDVVATINENLPADLFVEKTSTIALPVMAESVKYGHMHRHYDDGIRNYRFSLAFVELAAALCHGRMQNALRLFLEDTSAFGFTYTNVLAKIRDPKATIAGYMAETSYDVRRVYISAIRAMYVDRQFTGMERQTRQRTRIWEEIDKSQLESIMGGLAKAGAHGTQRDLTAQVRSAVTPGFVDLKIVLHSILVDCAGGIDASQTENNKMLLEALGLMQYIIRQGYYDPRPLDGVDDGVLLLGDELKDLVQYLVRVMDGRDDTGFIDARRRKELSQWEIEELSKPGSASRFEVNQENRIVFRLKTRSLQILNDLLDIRGSSRVDHCMKALSDARKHGARSRSFLSRSDTKGETVNPLADVVTFEVEGNEVGASHETRTTTDLQALGDKIANADDDDDNHDDSGFASTIRRMAKSAIKSDHDNADTLSMFIDKADEMKIAQILLDNLRYTENEDLVLSSFAALHHYKTEDSRLHDLLTSVTLVTTPEDASLFLVLYNLLMDFRKSIERLLELPYVHMCVSSCEKMAAHCVASHTARTLLRNIKIDDYVSDLLLTHPTNIHDEKYVEVVSQALKLVGSLCHDVDQLSQAMWADRLEAVFLPLLCGGPTDANPLRPEERQQIMGLTARTICHMCYGNRTFSVTFSKALTQVVVEQMVVFGKNLDLARILKSLVQVDGKVVEAAQTHVSKGFVEKIGQSIDGRLLPNEWAPGPGMEFTEVVEHALTNPSDLEENMSRQEKEMSLYCLMLETIGLCARGLMPHTELQAASTMGFEESIDKLLHLYQSDSLAKFQDCASNANDKLTGVKLAILLYMNDVFIDSDSEFTQAVVQRRMNGLWAMPPQYSENRSREAFIPLAQLLVGDLKQLTPSSSALFRKYVTQEVADFFVLYCVSAPYAYHNDEDEVFDSSVEKEREEVRTRLEIIGQAKQAGSDCIKKMSLGPNPLTEAELLGLQNMVNIVDKWLRQTDDIPPQLMESFRRAGAFVPDRPPPSKAESEVETLWACFVQMFGEQLDSAAGFLDVATDLNSDIPNTDDKYSQSLLIAARARIQKLQGNDDYKMPQHESELLCSILNIVRAIPYTVHGKEKRLKEHHVMQLYENVNVFIFRDPSVAVSESQITLCTEGWGILCWNILATEHFSPIHLAAVRLLQVLLAGGNFDVQTRLLNDLMDRTKAERDFLGSSCRRILRKGAEELRSNRKKQNATSDSDILLVASHLVMVLVSSCEHQHTGMQKYIPDQEGHEETYLLVPDIFEFVVELEREVKFGMENDAVDTLYRKCKGGEIYLLDVLEWCFRLLSFLCTGPNEDNQITVASCGILLVVNRIYLYTMLTDKSELAKLNLVDPSPDSTEDHWQDPSLSKCRLISYTNELLLTLLEGSSDKHVIASICQSLDFSIYGQHMRIIKNICDDMAPAQLRVSAGIRNSGWVRSQCFMFITTLEKLVSSDLPRTAVMPLMPVLRQKPMMEWYRARLGEVEVIRNGQPESLYFEMPSRWLDPSAYAEMVDDTTILMDEAFNSAASHPDRVSAFVEKVIQYIWTIDRNQRDMSALAQRVLLFLRLATGQWYLFILSLSINIVLLLSLGSADDSQIVFPSFSTTGSEGGLMSQWNAAMSFEDGFKFKNPTGVVYERWTTGESYIASLAPLHLLLSILSVFQFLMVKNPILSNVSSRAKMLRRMQRLRHSKQAVGSGFEDFVACTIHVKDLPPPRNAWNPEGFTTAKLKSVLLMYGEIGGITMWGRHSQQALVSFLQEDAVDRVTDTTVDMDANEWHRKLTIAGGVTNAMSTVSRDASRAVEAGKSRLKHGSARLPGAGNSRLVGNLSALGKELGHSTEMAMRKRTAELLEQAHEQMNSNGADVVAKSSPEPELPTPSSRGSGMLRDGLAEVKSKVSSGSRWMKSTFTQQETAYRHLNISKISLEQATRSTGEFSEKLKTAAREYSEGTSDAASMSLKQRVRAVVAQATNLNMAMANVMALLTYDMTDQAASSFISTTITDSLISLKLGPELFKVLVDLVFSIYGVFGHPLFFAYHLFHLFRAHAATIVLKSITTNLTRLTTTLILSLILMYFFAIMGYVYFSDRHTGENVENPGGPCANLLTCFVSYSFAGFLQHGLMYWLHSPYFPEGEVESAADALGPDGSRIIFEIAFVLIIGVAFISIITGIIVDTFGELRVAQDIAARYRISTCFITDIPFTVVPEQKKTSYLQYVFLLVFLRRKKLLAVSPLSPLEKMVADKIDVGDISWLPMGHGASLDDDMSRDGLDVATKPQSRAPIHTSVQMAKLNAQIAGLVDAVERIEARQVLLPSAFSGNGDEQDIEGATDVVEGEISQPRQFGSSPSE